MTVSPALGIVFLILSVAWIGVALFCGVWWRRAVRSEVWRLCGLCGTWMGRAPTLPGPGEEAPVLAVQVGYCALCCASSRRRRVAVDGRLPSTHSISIPPVPPAAEARPRRRGAAA